MRGIALFAVIVAALAAVIAAVAAAASAGDVKRYVKMRQM